MRGLRRYPKSVLRIPWREANAILRGIWSRLPIRPRSVLYESYAGNGVSCNPEAIFRHLLSSPDMSDLHHTWVLDRHRAYKDLRSEFASNRSVRFVRRGSPAYFRALATRGFLINNATFPPEFAKRSGQVYLNTWHGTPLKRMGYDLPASGALEAANTMRNFLSADYLLSQNDFMTRQMYEEAYRLRGIFTGRIIEEGYPRTDRQQLTADQRESARAALEKAGLPLNGRRLVLYAPTWRGNDFASPENNADEIARSAQRLEQLLGSDRYVVALKTHQSVHRQLADIPAYRSMLVPNEISTNVILGITDALVTDYSSIFIDYLPLPGPIVFFAQDSGDYLQRRGTYFKSEALPGPFYTDIEDVAKVITGRTAVPAATKKRRDEWRTRFTGQDDGDASRRVADVVFRGQAETRKTISISATTRTSILLHIGSMRSNGVTSAALNLLDAIDTNLFDVSVIFSRPAQEGQPAENQRRIPAHVRQFIRFTEAESKVGRMARRLLFFLSQTSGRAISTRKDRAWNAQWRWSFGNAAFDHIIDFDGYGPFWANLLLRGPSKSHSIWLHNDMAAEQHRVIRGRQRIKRSLGSVFTLYPSFDHLVSVSPDLAVLNRRSLADRLGIRPNAFVSARNIVDGERVLAESEWRDRKSAVAPDGSPPWFGELTDPGRKSKWLVTVGRLSTEKNQARLIRAFALAQQRRPDIRLLIIGDGSLRGDLVDLADRCGVRGRVTFAGYLANPFPAMASADCFVMSSDYEGQPMVILEAAILGLPIVAVNFTTARDAIPNFSISIVDQNDEALALGMLRGLEEPHAESSFNFRDYNGEALAEFSLAVGMTADGKPESKRKSVHTSGHG
jgi:CDP-glycerol glycerophosphotransferase